MIICEGCNLSLIEDRHDPEGEGAVVMPSPSQAHQKKWNKRCDQVFPPLDWSDSVVCRDAPVVPVVIDPILARKLRPHQVEGAL